MQSSGFAPPAEMVSSAAPAAWIVGPRVGRNGTFTTLRTIGGFGRCSRGLVCGVAVGQGRSLPCFSPSVGRQLFDAPEVLEATRFYGFGSTAGCTKFLDKNVFEEDAAVNHMRANPRIILWDPLAGQGPHRFLGLVQERLRHRQATRMISSLSPPR